jgi:hypothetical protein
MEAASAGDTCQKQQDLELSRLEAMMWHVKDRRIIAMFGETASVV